MKHIDPYRHPGLIKSLVSKLHETNIDGRSIAFMEVCGTHTMNIHRHGIRDVLPENIRMISGPGCPVCVTPRTGIDNAVAYARIPDTIVASFGDMLRVPGSTSSLIDERSKGADVRVVYSPLDAVEIAKKNPGRKIVFLGIGFETTVPTVAMSIIKALDENLKNYFVLPLGKLIPPAMDALVSNPNLKIDGFLCPAHVSAIIGMKPYESVVAKGIPCVIAGFEPADILSGLIMLLSQVIEGRAEVENEYSRVVRYDGNPKARGIIKTVFEPDDVEWYGLGTIPMSGLKIRDEYAELDASRALPVDVEPTIPAHGCRCGDVLTGLIDPPDCPLFGKKCTPEMPFGACMVSSEGTCAAWFKYRTVS
ncbi:MAG TPA: hydrogenase formation protein HypD [Firmicutes bacterium]|nr:hydrogenase formation protein HypD [Bacillota bacterium]